MNKENLSTKEKLTALSFLQEKIPYLGNFSLSFLKTKKKFQLSFVNGYKEKFINEDLDLCLQEAIDELDNLHFMEFKTNWFAEMDRENENVRLKAKISDLEDKLHQYENPPKMFASSVSEENGCSLEDVLKEGDEIEKIAIKVEEILEPIKVITDDFKARKKSPKKRKSKYKDEDVEREMLRKLKALKVPRMQSCSVKSKTRGRPSKYITKIEELKNTNIHIYDEEYRKAYNRLTNRISTKNKNKVQNLQIKANKYNISKDMIVDDMKRKLGKEYDKLNSAEYLRNWNLAKSRIWNKEYHKHRKSSPGW